MTLLGFLSVGCGAVLGAWLRWLFSVHLNNPGTLIPYGTLLANFVGAYLIGLVASFLSVSPSISPQVRLMLITGLLGSLTTFSTFSLESVEMIFLKNYALASLHLGLHVLGSIFFTLLGILTFKTISGIFSS